MTDLPEPSAADPGSSPNKLRPHEPYLCPGEHHPIARPVHLARLAAGFSACRTCTHRHELGQLQTQPMLQALATVPKPVSLFTADGVRGVYANELTRRTLSNIAAAVARQFWDEANPADPRIWRIAPGEAFPAVELRRQRRALGVDDDLPPPVVQPATEPLLVVGMDHRSSSADLLEGVLSSLRQGGCRVALAGVVSRPVWEFAVQQTRAQGGVYVTGGTSSLEFNGIDVIDQQGWDWTYAPDWEQVQTRLAEGFERPVRRSSDLQGVDVRRAYLESLQPLWKGLRSLRVAVLSTAPTVTGHLLELASLAGITLLLEQRKRDCGGTLDPPDRLADELHALLRDGQADVGLLIGSDARSCYIMDEHGEILLPEQATQLLQFGKFPVVTTDYNGRYWLTPGRAECDALRTMARVLQSLSRSDQPLSAWLS